MEKARFNLEEVQPDHESVQFDFKVSDLKWKWLGKFHCVLDKKDKEEETSSGSRLFEQLNTLTN